MDSQHITTDLIRLVIYLDDYYYIQSASHKLTH